MRREKKKWTIIAAPKKPDPEIKYHLCKIHKCRMVDVGENVLRCPLCGSNIIAEEEKDDIFKITGTILL